MNNQNQLGASELASFCTQLAMILKAGVGVQEGISIMAEDNKTAKGGEILKAVEEKAAQGESFRTALENAGVFPKYMLDMVQIGEQSGRLDEVMESLAAYYERREAISRSIKSAVTYPVLMIGMMLVVIGVLVAKVLPIFSEVFAQLGSQLSPFSQGILRFGEILNQYAVAIVVGIAVLAVAAAVLAYLPKGRAFFTRLFHSFVGTRGLARKIAAGRFASSMAMMLQSGMDVDDALAMSSQIVDDDSTKERILTCQKQITEGVSFSEALGQAAIFSGVYTRMVAVGFKTGTVDTVMQRIADHYETEVSDKISSVISVLEPTLVAVLSLIVGMVLLSVMLPLMGIMSSIG